VYVGDWGRDRPWWQHEAIRGQVVHRYIDDRPGTYRPANVTNVQIGRWQRDTRKPAPRPPARTLSRAPNARPGTGYSVPTPGAARPVIEPPRNIAVPQEVRGAVTAQASTRGQQSRQTAASSTPPPRPAGAVNPARTPPPRPAGAVTPARTPPPRPVGAVTPARTPPPRPAGAVTPARTPPPPAIRPAPVPPAARPSAPIRGGAVGGYQNGSDAARSSSRGVSSRGPTPPPVHR
jgi:hypothetical protein